MGKKVILTILLIAALFGCEHLLNDYSVAEPVEICNDDIDNDNDGDTDCWDTDCGFEGPVELTCNDGRDNDCDGLWDRSDSDCAGRVEICGDGTDNDGDTLVDCADADDCLDRPSGGCTLSCSLSSCNCDLFYENDFSSPEEGFGENDTDDYMLEYTGGEYNIEVRKENYLAWSYVPGEHVFTDFTVECDVMLVSDDSDHMGGFVLRHQESLYLFVGIFGGQRYLVQKQEGGEWFTIISQTYSPHINAPGEWNHLKVTAIGSQFHVCINGAHLDSFEDESIASGNIAITGGTWGSPTSETHFDNFKLFNE